MIAPTPNATTTDWRLDALLAAAALACATPGAVTFDDGGEPDRPAAPGWGSIRAAAEDATGPADGAGAGAIAGRG